MIMRLPQNFTKNTCRNFKYGLLPLTALLVAMALFFLGVSVTLAQEPAIFKILSITGDNAEVVDQVGGLDYFTYGGFAASDENLFITGYFDDDYDDSVVVTLSDLSYVDSLPEYLESMVSDLKTETVYVLANNGFPIQEEDYDTTITDLLIMDGTTGEFTGDSISLSSPVPVYANDAGDVWDEDYPPVLLLSGFGRIGVHNGDNLYAINLPSGTVVDLGAMELPDTSGCYSWAMWGVLEYFDGANHIIYPDEDSVLTRARVPDGQTTELFDMAELGLGTEGTCGLTASLPQNRWYFTDYFDDWEYSHVGFADVTYEVIELEFSKDSAPNPVSHGQPFTYTLNVDNTGAEDTYSGIVVTDTLPAAVTFNSATSSQGSCTEADHVVSCSIGALSPGAGAAITINVTAPAVGGPVTNNAVMNSNETESRAVSQVTEVGAANLTISKSASVTDVVVGSPLNYTVIITNNGPDLASGVVVTDILPAIANPLLNSATPSQGGPCTETDGVVSCPLGALPAGESATIAIQTTPRYALPAPPDRTYYAEHGDNYVYVINPYTGETLDDIYVELDLPDDYINGLSALAKDPTTDKLWAMADMDDGYYGNRVLITIDPFTGEAALIGDPGDYFSALAFDLSGTLYAVTGDGAHVPETLYTLSKTDATPTKLRALGNGGDGEALAFNPNTGLLYHASGSGSDKVFETIDPTTLEITNIPLSGYNYYGTRALAYNAQDNYFLLADKDDYLVWLSDDGVASYVGELEYGAKGLAVSGEAINSAVVTANELETNPPDNLATARVEVRGPDVVMYKYDDPHQVGPDDTLYYELYVYNRGSYTATGVTVTDTLPDTVSFEDVWAYADEEDCDESGGVVTCNLGTLPPDEEFEVIIEVTTPSDPGIITNTASVSITETENQANNSVTIETVVNGIDLSVTKEAYPSLALINNPVTYTLTIYNDGPFTARHVVVTDTLPPEIGAVFGSVTASQGGPCAEAGGVITCALGVLDEYQSATVDIVVTPTLHVPAAALFTGDRYDPFLRNVDPYTFDTRADVTVTLPGYEVNRFTALDTDPTTGMLWGVVTVNDDSWDRRLVTLKAATGQATLVGNTSANGHLISDIAFGSDGTLYGVTGNEGTDNRSLVTINKNNGAVTRLLSLGGNYNGQALTFNPTDGLLYRLSGDDLFESIDPDTLARTPIPLSGNTTSSPKGMDWMPDNNAFLMVDSYSLYWLTLDGRSSYYAGLNHGASALAYLPGAYNQAEVTSTEPEQYPDDNSTRLNAVAETADLTIVKSDSADLVATGTPLSYTIAVTNYGPAFAPGVVVTDTLPDGAGFVSAIADQGDCSENGGVVICPIGMMAAGDAINIGIEVTAPVTPQLMSNVAAVGYSQPDGNPGDNVVTETTTVGGVDLTVGKWSSPAVIDVGGLITYTLVVTNNGPFTATSVVLRDTLPAVARPRLVSAVSAHGTCTQSDGVVSCPAGTLVPGATATATIVISATSGMPEPADTLYSTYYYNTLYIRDSEDGDELSSQSISFPGYVNEIRTLATDPTTGKLWFHGRDGEDDHWWLATLDPESGNTAVIADMTLAGYQFYDMAFGSDGTLYATTRSYNTADPRSLVTVDKQTGAVTLLLRLGDNYYEHTLAFNPRDGMLYHLTNSSSSNTYTFERIDPHTLARTIIPYSYDYNWYDINSTIYGLTYRPASGSFYLAIYPRKLVEITPDGQGSVVTTDSSGPYSYYNVAFSAGVLNWATATAAEPDINPINTAAIAQNMVNVPELRITKSDDRDPAAGGSQVSYELTVYNDGRLDAPDVVVTDTLPVGAGFVSATPDSGSCSETGGVVTCTLGTLAADDDLAVTVVVTAPNIMGTMVNTAEVRYRYSEPILEDNVVTESTTLNAVNLELRKDVSDDPVGLLNRMEYYLNVYNDTPVAATNVIVTDTLPADTIFAAASTSQGSCGHNAGVVTCTLETMNPFGGWVGITIEVTPTVAQGLEYGVYAGGYSGSNGRIDVARADQIDGEYLDEFEAQPLDETLGVLLGMALDPTSNYMYGVVTVNDDSEDRRLVIITPYSGDLTLVGDVSAGGHLVSDITFGSDGTLYGVTGQGGTNRHSLVSIDTTTAEVTVLTGLNDGGGHALAFNPDDGLLYHANSDDGLETINPTTLARTQIPVTGYLWSRYWYNIQAMDYRPSRGDFLLINNRTELIALSTSGVATAVDYYWSNDDFYSLAVVESLENRAVVSSDQVEADASDNVAELRSSVLIPDLEIYKSDSADPVDVNSTLTYLIEVYNNGPGIANDVVVTDTLPAGVAYLSATPEQGSCSETDGIITCPLGSMDEEWVEIEVEVTTPAAPTVLENEAEVYGVPRDLIFKDNSTSEPPGLAAETWPFSKRSPPPPLSPATH
jgi:uncharacterized repeat protein (TIGR01451 family)